MNPEDLANNVYIAQEDDEDFEDLEFTRIGADDVDAEVEDDQNFNYLITYSLQNIYLPDRSKLNSFSEINKPILDEFYRTIDIFAGRTKPQDRLQVVINIAMSIFTKLIALDKVLTIVNTKKIKLFEQDEFNNKLELDLYSWAPDRRVGRIFQMDVLNQIVVFLTGNFSSTPTSRDPLLVGGFRFTTDVREPKLEAVCDCTNGKHVVNALQNLIPYKRRNYV